MVHLRGAGEDIVEKEATSWELSPMRVPRVWTGALCLVAMLAAAAPSSTWAQPEPQVEAEPEEVPGETEPPEGEPFEEDPNFPDDPLPPEGYTSTSTGPSATPVESVGEQQAKAGRAFYEARNYVAALEAFRTAFQDTPTAALAYNTARCHERLSQWAEAIEWYEKYTELEVDPRDRADVLDKIDLLKTRLGPAAGIEPYEARMISGKRAYSRGDFEGAIEDFKAAFDARPEAAALYNIAKSYEKMARYEDALDFYGQYLEIAINAPDRADVEAIMDRIRRDLKARFQELSVASDPPGADVYLDDRNEGIVGQTNLRAKIRPGPHTLYIDLNGYQPVRRDFVMPDDTPLALEFSLVPLEDVGYVTIDIKQPGARIFIDGAIVGLSPYTQKKALPSGEHQIQVELVGYNRFTEAFTITREQETNLAIDLKKYNPPISDGTLSDWGRNLIIFGLVGGGLGVGGPILYQEVVRGRPYFTELGPETRNGQPFFDGTSASLRSNNELDTLETIQLISGITGGVLVVGGLSVYMYKWFRKTPPPPVTAGVSPGFRPGIEITGFGVSPAPGGGGGTIGLTGRF